MEFKRLTSAQEVESLIEWHNKHMDVHLILDTETTDKDPRKAELLDVQLSTNDPFCPAIFCSSYAGILNRLDRRKVLVAHFYPYDAHVLVRHGCNLLDRVWRDTLIQGHLIDENRESYSLDSYVQEYYGDNYKEEFWAKYKSYQEAPQAERDLYACKDIYYTQKLYNRQQEDLWVQGIPDSLVRMVHELQRHLLKTQIQGLAVDLNYLTVKGVDLKTKIQRLLPELRKETEIYCQLWEMQEYERELEKRKSPKGKAGVKKPIFSFDSPKQIQALLYDSLHLPVQHNEKTKSPSVDDASLEKLKGYHPIIQKLQEYRGHQKIFTAFIEGTQVLLDGGRIYPHFGVAGRGGDANGSDGGTKTGRISHSKPNLGQLPSSGGIRGIYIPDPGRVLLSADYSQLEVNLEANLTRDENTTRIFRDGLSKHDITAKGLGIERDKAKTLNFAMGYHCTHFKVAKILNVSVKEAEKIWHRYWDTYAGCRDLKKKTDAMVDNGEHIVTLLGRRRRFEIKKRSPYDADYRKAYNFRIQGLGADITSQAFCDVSSKLQREDWGRGLFTVHDELIVDVKEEFAAEAEAFMLQAMTAVGDRIGLSIPLKAESSGPMGRWED